MAQGSDGDLEQATAFWHQWQGEELPYIDEHRPWESADIVVAGVGPPAAGEDHVLIVLPPGRDTPRHL